MTLSEEKPAEGLSYLWERSASNYLLLSYLWFTEALQESFLQVCKPNAFHTQLWPSTVLTCV